jgi:hypothetical protein
VRLAFWWVAAAFACNSGDPELFTAEVFEPPPPILDVPCDERSPWTEVAVDDQRGLSDVWSSGDGALWFAGGAGAILEYRDSEWTDYSVESDDLMAIHGSSTNDIWVVGRNGYAARWDGAAWKPVDTHTTKILLGVWAIAPNDVWMIGEEGVRRFDGTDVVIEPSWPDGPMNAIWASGPTDVRIAANTETFRFDGARFTTYRVEHSGRLTAIWGKDGDRVWALGHNDADKPGFAMFDTDRWLFGAAPRRAFFFALWGVDADGLFAGSSESSIFFWNEARGWCREYAGGIGAITGFWGASHSDVWAAGSISGTDGETRPIVLRRSR